jgi:hypothetical protein
LFSSSCVTCAASFSGLSMFDSPAIFSHVYLRQRFSGQKKKIQTMVHKTLHRKQQTKHTKPTKIRSEVQVVPPPLVPLS